MLNRPPVTKDEIKQSLKEVEEAIFRRLEQKGYGSYASSHEMFGILDEEVNEVRDEIRNNDHNAICAELIDVAVTAVFGHTCISTEKVDW
jgi:NTP pyrophosphatase (non-canonical NTP hydrolase)